MYKTGEDMLKNRIKIIIIWIIELLLCIFYHNITFRLLLLASLLLPVISLVQLIVIFKYIKTDIEINNKITNKSRKIKVVVSVDNNNCIPVSECNMSIRIYNKFYDVEELYNISVPISMSSKESVTFEFVSNICGNIDVAINEIEVYDMLRLKKIKKNVDIRKSITVLPNMRNKSIDLNRIINCVQKENKISINKSDPYEVSSVREYIDGDSLKDIHWKLSSKQDKLMVKENGILYDDKVELVLELYDDNKDMVEKTIENLFSFSYKMIKNKREFRVSWYNYELARYNEILIKNENDIIEALREIFNTKVSTKMYNSYTAYLDRRKCDESRALYITDNECAKMLDGNIIENIDDNYIIMTI